MLLKGEDYRKFREQLIDHEGIRLKAYLDTVDVLTIGIGHNCKTSPVAGVSKVGDTITREKAYDLFDMDIRSHSDALEYNLPWLVSLNPPRQAVIYNLGFNLGVTGLLGFKNTLRMIKQGDYSGAAKGMLQSKWATQVGRRAKCLSRQMETGEWQTTEK